MMPPRVTIGVPVFNGASLLDECLASLSRQSWPNLEILVGDNASTDDSLAIAKRWAAKDKRIKVVARPENIGGLANFRDLLDRADGEYFMWRAYDDLSDPAYVETLSLALMQRPGAVLAVPDVVMVKMRRNLRRHRPLPRNLPSAGPARSRALLRNAEAGWFYGLHKTSFLRDSIPDVLENYPHDWGWDHLVIFLAAVRGDIAMAPSAHFEQRMPGGVDNYSRPRRGRDYRRVAMDFYAFCSARLEGLSPYDALMTKLAVLQQINRRVVRLERLIKASLGR